MSKKNLLIILLVALILSLNPIGPNSTSAAVTAENKWLSLGPVGGSVPALVVDPQVPSTVYAGTANGVYKSTDGGGSWVSTGLWNNWIYALAVDPRNSNTVYAGTRGQGVYKSLDGGASWQPANMGIGDQVVYALAINPANPDILYIGGRSINYNLGVNADEWDPGAAQTPGNATSSGNAVTGPPWGGGVFRSKDGGKSWTRINNGLTEDYVYALAIDPTDPLIVYAGAHTKGVFKSTNSGDSWVWCSDFSWLNGQIRALVIDPWNPEEILAGTWHGGIVVSANKGASWNQGDLIDQKIRTLAYGQNHVVYAGSWGNAVSISKRRDDNGRPVFDPAFSGLQNPFVNFLAVSPSDSATVYGGFDSYGTFKTTNAAGSWFPARSGLASTVVSSLVTQPGSPTIMYSGTIWDGVYQSNNGGASWHNINNGLGNLFVHSLVINAAVPAQIFAGTDGGVFMTSNSGGIWSAVNNGLPQTGVLTLALVPGNPPLLYAGTLLQGVYVSTNGGAYWTATTLTGNQINTLLVDPRSPGTVYAGTEVNGLYKSIDSGANWLATNQGLGSKSIKSLALDPDQPDTVYVGTTTGIYQSDNAGATWQTMNIGSNTVISILVDPAAPLFIFVGTSNNGFFGYNRNSKAWTNINDGLNNLSVSSIMIAAAPGVSTQPAYPAPGDVTRPSYPAPDVKEPSAESQFVPPAPVAGISSVSLRPVQANYVVYLPLIPKIQRVYFPSISTPFAPLGIFVSTLGGGTYWVSLDINILSSNTVFSAYDEYRVLSEGSSK